MLVHVVIATAYYDGCEHPQVVGVFRSKDDAEKEAEHHHKESGRLDENPGGYVVPFTMQ